MLFLLRSKCGATGRPAIYWAPATIAWVGLAGCPIWHSLPGHLLVELTWNLKVAELAQ